MTSLQNTNIVERSELVSLHDFLQASLITGKQSPEFESYAKGFNDGVGRAIHHVKTLLEVD